jgi:threonine dehydratase
LISSDPLTAQPVTLALIEDAAKRIASFVHRTPIEGSRQLGEMFGCELRFKCEHLQKVGAFKARGAHNAVMQLSDEAAARGVTTHSSGNHAAALALAARNRGIRAYAVMPDNSPPVKKEAVAGYGAEIIYCEPTLAARESTLEEVQARTGAHFVHPYEDPRVICGQGTVGLEIVQQSGDAPPDVVIVPVGGGGLLAGVAVALAALLPGCQVIAAEPSGADDAHRSFHSGRWQPQLAPDTIADGLLTSLGKLNFELIQAHVDDIVTVTDDGIVEAMRLIWSRCKQIVEPSAAVTLAAVMSDADRFRGRRVACVLSGGNIDLNRLPWMVRD